MNSHVAFLKAQLSKGTSRRVKDRYMIIASEIGTIATSSNVVKMERVFRYVQEVHDLNMSHVLNELADRAVKSKQEGRSKCREKETLHHLQGNEDVLLIHSKPKGAPQAMNMEDRMHERATNLTAAWRAIETQTNVQSIMLRVVVDSVVPQRSEAYQYLRFGMNTQSLGGEVPREDRYRLHFRTKTHTYVITIQETKIGAIFGTLSLPSQMTQLLDEYVQSRQLNDGDYVFKSNYKVISGGDDRWSVQNFRHSMGNFLVSTHADMDVVKSMAVAMNTSTSSLVGVASKKRQLSRGKGAYSNSVTATRDAELATDVLRMAQHIPFTGWFLIPVCRDISVCKVLATNTKTATCTMLVFHVNFSHESNVLVMAPETRSACILQTSQDMAMRYRLMGTNEPTPILGDVAQYKWLSLPNAKALFEEASLLFGTRVHRCHPKRQDQVSLEPGQFAIFRGELMEVRAVNGMSVIVVPFTLRGHEWRISSDADAFTLNSNTLNMVLDWSFNSSGGVIVR